MVILKRVRRDCNEPPPSMFAFTSGLKNRNDQRASNGRGRFMTRAMEFSLAREKITMPRVVTDFYCIKYSFEMERLDCRCPGERRSAFEIKISGIAYGPSSK